MVTNTQLVAKTIQFITVGDVYHHSAVSGVGGAYKTKL